MKFIIPPNSTAPLIINQAKRMAFAHQIAEASSCMDWLRSSAASAESINEARIEAPLHIQRLENIVRELAGDYIGEIYAPEELSEINLRAIAGRSCCSAEEEAQA